MICALRDPTEAERFDDRPRQWLVILFDRATRKIIESKPVIGTFYDGWRLMSDKCMSGRPDLYGLIQIASIDDGQRGSDE